MKPGQFTTEMADALQVSRSGMGVAMRSLRAADLMETGGRGYGGADLGELDAGRVLVAYLCSDRPGERIGERIAPLLKLSRDPDETAPPPLSLEGCLDFPSTFDLDTALYGLIMLFRDGPTFPAFREASGIGRLGDPTPPFCQVELYLSKPFAIINLNDWRYTFSPWPPPPARNPPPEPPVDRVATISHHTIERVAEIFRAEIAT